MLGSGTRANEGFSPWRWLIECELTTITSARGVASTEERERERKREGAGTLFSIVAENLRERNFVRTFVLAEYEN